MAQTPGRPPRPSQPVPARSTGGVRSPDVERALALRDVMEHAVKVQREITAPSALKGKRGKAIFATLVCVPALVFCAYSWFLRPEFIWGPGAAAVPAGRQEASVRLSMFFLRQRIEEYRRAEGAFPSSLASVGDTVDGVSYAVVSDSVFELRAVYSGRPIVLRSNESVEVFLGNSSTLILGRPIR